MNTTVLLSHALAACEAAVEVEPTDDGGEHARLNLDRFTSLLLKNDCEIFVASRGQLLTELDALREERSTQRVKEKRATGSDQHTRILAQIEALDRREKEIVRTLWPPR